MLIINLPNFGKNTDFETVVSVDIIKISKETNLKNTSKSNSAKTKKAHKKKSSKQKYTQIKHKASAPKILETKPLTMKKKESLDSKDNLENLLQDLEGRNGTKISKNFNQKEEQNYSTKLHDNNLPLSISEKDNIKTQIERKFVNPVALDFKPQELVVKLRLIMNIDGTIKDIITLNNSTYSKNNLDTFLTLRNGLMRAAHIASPLENLTQEKYYGPKGWQEIELTFDAYNLMNIS
jgi:hypothetical protein